jgi:hypothetical protein
MKALHGPLATSEGVPLFSTDGLWVSLQLHRSGASEGMVPSNELVRAVHMIFDALM